jgi:hypothetical protein
VSLGVLATALWLIGRDGALASLATPKEDRGALELDVRAAETLGRQRVKATEQAKLKLASSRQSHADDGLQADGLGRANPGSKAQGS